MFEFLFGLKKKKKCTKVRRSKRDHRKKCKGKQCSVSSRRTSDHRKKCRQPRIKAQIKHAAKLAAKKVAERGGSAVEQAEAAAAIVADITESHAAAPVEVAEIVAEVSAEIAQDAGANPEEIQQVIETTSKNVANVVMRNNPIFESGYDSAMDAPDYDLGSLDFGKMNFGFCSSCKMNLKKMNFGAECKSLPRTSADCTMHLLNGGYPCYLTSSGCRNRIDKKSRHTFYVVGQTKSPIVREVLEEELRTREIATQTDPTMLSPLRRINSSRRNQPSISTQTEEDYGFLNELDFGKKRKVRRNLPGYTSYTPSRNLPGYTSYTPPRRSVLDPVSASDLDFGKKRKVRRNLPGYTSYTTSRNLPGYTSYTPPRRSVLDPVSASDLDFGKKRKVKGKPSAKICKLCKKYKIRLTKKVGGKRVYKSATVLKKQISKKMKK